MTSKTFSVTRTKATWKPRVTATDLPFFRCGADTLLGVGGCVAPFFSDPGRNPVAELPYAHLSAHGAAQTSNVNSAKTQADDSSGTLASEPDAHAVNMSECALPLVELDELDDAITFDYAVIGGYNNNAVRISWSIRNDDYALTWVALKTFTGFQLKYVLPKKRSPLIFALADEDAYVYCDKDPCLECIFMCKRGFVAYACVEGLGIVRLPLERASAHWESR